MAMKFNDKEISAFAHPPPGDGASSVVDGEGYLLKRGERPREGYKQRWFILKGNLLFYYRSHLTLAEPLGVVVLERVSVAFSGDTAVAFGFKLEFDGSGTRVYYLSAPSNDARRQWMDALKHASYEYLRGTLMSLQARLKELTGRDPLREALSACTTPQVPSKETESAAYKFARNNTLSHQSRRAAQHAAKAAERDGDRQPPATDYLGLPSPHQSPARSKAASPAAPPAPSLQLELSLACEGLPALVDVDAADAADGAAAGPSPPGRQRNIFVEIWLRPPPGDGDARGTAQAVGRTEVIHGTLDPQFVTISTLPLPDGSAADTHRTVEFLVYDQETPAAVEADVEEEAEGQGEPEEEPEKEGDIEGEAEQAGPVVGHGAEAEAEAEAANRTMIGAVTCRVSDLQQAPDAGPAVFNLAITDPASGAPAGLLVVESVTLTYGPTGHSPWHAAPRQAASIDHG